MPQTDHSDLPVEFHDELGDAIADAYAGGASGEGWTFMGEPIPKDEMKIRMLQDPDKMRHVTRLSAAAWAVVERWVDGQAATDEEERR